MNIYSIESLNKHQPTREYLQKQDLVMTSILKSRGDKRSRSEIKSRPQIVDGSGHSEISKISSQSPIKDLPNGSYGYEKGSLILTPYRWAPSGW
jgi:hypothetical protein